MKIIPVVSEHGLRYKVVKRSLFRSLTLHEHGKFFDAEDCLSRYAFEELKFKTVSDAVSEIKKQFGETAKIQEWMPK